MAAQKLTNGFMEKMLNETAWKEISRYFQWSEQMLDKYKGHIDWKEISQNFNIAWTPAMLDKFKELIDWKELSGTVCDTILTEDCLEEFKDYPLIDRFID